MSFSRFATSDGFFHCSEPLSNPEITEFLSLRGRGMAVYNFFEKLAIIPIAFVYKAYKTFFSLLGLGVSVVLLAATLCLVSGIRGFFIKRMTSFVKDLADWVFWPVSIAFCLVRLVLAATVHPALYFHI